MQTKPTFAKKRVETTEMDAMDYYQGKMHVLKLFLKENVEDPFFVLLSNLMQNYYAYVLAICDCVEVWLRREMELDIVDDEEGVEGT